MLSRVQTLAQFFFFSDETKQLLNQFVAAVDETQEAQERLPDDRSYDHHI